MRIAVLTNAYPPMKGGASRIAELHVQMLEAAGHEVRVFRPETGWFAYPAPIRLFFHLFDLLSNRKFVDKIIGWHPEVLLTHNLTGCGFGTPSAIQSERTRWIHVLHDVQLFQPDGRLRDPQPITHWQKLWGGLRARVLGKPDLVISPTGWLLEQHKRRGFFSDVRVEVLPSPAPAISFALRAPSEPLKLFFLGHTPDKGIELVKKLQKRIADPVHIITQAPNEEVLDAMRQADVMLFPSQIAENQPVVLLEAMSLGLPVVASDVGGVRETLKGAGVVVQRDDVDAWVLAISRLRDPEEYREQTTMMYERAKEYDAEVYAKRLIGLVAG
ncbi:glycosyltransferase family 4 protein [Candidatus Uhrbacteria bacterium]|nr:glycosyltransferase family 4 protein [Candidatus Uhrbacteria bacterium]